MEAWKPLLFIVPVEGLSIGKGTLPGIHIFARLFNPDYQFTSHLIQGELPTKDTVIIFGWAATGYKCVCVCVYV